jgi:hypothetical protein
MPLLQARLNGPRRLLPCCKRRKSPPAETANANHHAFLVEAGCNAYGLEGETHAAA